MHLFFFLKERKYIKIYTLKWFSSAHSIYGKEKKKKTQAHHLFLESSVDNSGILEPSNVLGNLGR